MRTFEKINSSNIEKNNEFISKANSLFLSYYKNIKTDVSSDDFQKIYYKNFKSETKKLFSKIKTSEIKSIKTENNTILIKLKNKTLVLDMNKEKNFYIGEKEKLDKLRNNIPELVTQASDYLYLMDRIFYKNSKEWFGELDEDDILSKKEINHFIDSGYKVEGLKKYNSEKIDLKLLQKEFGLIYSEINKIDRSKLSKEEKDNIISIEKKYLEIIMGVGDNYEGAVSILKRDTNNVKKLSNSIINHGTINESLDYYNRLMIQIDKNNNQATNVEKSYKYLNELFIKGIFERIKKEKAPLPVITKFVKMLRGDGYEIEDNLRSAGIEGFTSFKYNFANEVIMYGMQRKNGIVDKIRNSGKFSLEDEKIKNLKPSDIINNVSSKLESIQLKGAIISSGFYEDLLKSKEKPYSELTAIQKSKLSVLYRLDKKISKNPEQIKSVNDLANILKEISEDYLEESSEKLKEIINGGYNIFDEDFYIGSVGESFGLTDDENELYKQFKDTNGIGLFDVSDNTVQLTKGAGKFALMIGVGALAPGALVPGATMMIQGAVASASAAIMSNIIMGKGYNTKEEAAIYLGSDLILSIITGGLSGKILFDVNSNFAKILSKKIPKDIYKNLLIQGIDLSFLGLGPEILRTNLFENHYYTKSIFSDVNEKHKKNI